MKRGSRISPVFSAEDYRFEHAHPTIVLPSLGYNSVEKESRCDFQSSGWNPTALL